MQQGSTWHMHAVKCEKPAKPGERFCGTHLRHTPYNSITVESE